MLFERRKTSGRHGRFGRGGRGAFPPRASWLSVTRHEHPLRRARRQAGRGGLLHARPGAGAHRRGRASRRPGGDEPLQLAHPPRVRGGARPYRRRRIVAAAGAPDARSEEEEGAQDGRPLAGPRPASAPGTTRTPSTPYPISLTAPCTTRRCGSAASPSSPSCSSRRRDASRESCGRSWRPNRTCGRPGSRNGVSSSKRSGRSRPASLVVRHSINLGHTNLSRTTYFLLHRTLAVRGECPGEPIFSRGDALSSR